MSVWRLVFLLALADAFGEEVSLLKQVLPVIGLRNPSCEFLLVNYRNMHSSPGAGGVSLATVIALVPFPFASALIAAGLKQRGSKNGGQSGRPKLVKPVPHHMP